MNVRLLFFAGLRDSVGTAEMLYDVRDGPQTVAALREQLTTRYPDLALESVRVAINEDFVEADHALAEADLVAFIPPVSGG